MEKHFVFPRFICYNKKHMNTEGVTVMSIKEHMNVEKTKLSKMTLKGKAEYIWEYYKIPIVGTIVFVAIVVSLITSITGKKDTILTTTVIGYPNDTFLSPYLKDGFEKYLEIDKENEEVLMDTSMTFDSSAGANQDYISTSKLMTLMAAGSLDVIICEQGFIDHYSKQGTFLNLETDLPEDLKEALSEKFVMTTNEEGIKIPNSIDLTGSELVKESGMPFKEPRIAIVVNSQLKENAFEFLRYLFEV